MAITIVLLLVLGGVFLLGFTEAVNVAIPLVAVFLGLNAIVIVTGLIELSANPVAVDDWWAVLTASGGGFSGILLPALLAFPLLVLGLSGFETGVSMMPLVKANGRTPEERLASRIRNTRKLLTAAAVIMSVYLITSSIVTTLLIPPEEFEQGGAANGRALAYLAHGFYGDVFGTVYDLSSVLILWFAGASAMAGSDQHRAPLPPDVRHGTRMEPRDPPGRARVHHDQRDHHDRVPGGCRCAGRRVRHRHPGHDGVGLGRGADLRHPPPPIPSRRSGTPC